MRIDRDFNILCSTASHNEFAANAMSLMHSLSRRFWYVHNQQSANMPLTAKLHADIARAIAAGDPRAGRAGERPAARRDREVHPRHREPLSASRLTAENRSRWTTAAKAQLFQRLHLGPEILVIANAWDAASARVFEQAGIRAVGTGSAGVAFSHGYRDDEFIPREVMLRAIGEMVRAVDVPVTADILSGLGDTPEAVAATIREVIALGASGVNIEDGSDIGGAHLVDVELHCDKIRAACEAARQAGVETSSSTPAPTATG